MLVFPIISKFTGINRIGTKLGRLLKPIHRKGGLRGFLWANFYEKDGCLHVVPYENQFCGAIKTQAYSNCLIEIPSGEVYIETDNLVKVWKLP